MPDRRYEFHLRRSVGVRLRELELAIENTALTVSTGKVSSCLQIPSHVFSVQYYDAPDAVLLVCIPIFLAQQSERERPRKILGQEKDREVQRKNILERVGRACNANIPLIDIAIVGQACREKLGRLLLELCFVSSQVEVRMLMGVDSTK